MVATDNNLVKTILDIAFKHKLGHLGSYLTAVDIIDKIYAKMQSDDIFILSSGHAALALYACNQKYYNIDAESMFVKHGGHPHRDESNKLHCSTGSLGLGIVVALGRAIANPQRKVYVLLSDGECAEGSVWEALKTIVEQKINNIEVHVNINGFAAYMDVDIEYLTNRLQAFLPHINLHYTTVEHFPFLKGLNAHYHVMSEENYKQAYQLL